MLGNKASTYFLSFSVIHSFKPIQVWIFSTSHSSNIYFLSICTHTHIHTVGLAKKLLFHQFPFQIYVLLSFFLKFTWIHCNHSYILLLRPHCSIHSQSWKAVCSSNSISFTLSSHTWAHSHWKVCFSFVLSSTTHSHIYENVETWKNGT